MNSKAQTKIIRPVPEESRQGWAKSFREMRENQDDKLLDKATATDWDNQEWEWYSKSQHSKVKTQK